MRAFKVSYNDVGEGGVAVNCEKNTIFPVLYQCLETGTYHVNVYKLALIKSMLRNWMAKATMSTLMLGFLGGAFALGNLADRIGRSNKH